jgi:ABC-type Fe3+/spermidine/putrescine transport system ATPase subunit
LIFPSAEEISLDSRSNKFSDFSNPQGVLFVRPERIKIIPAPGDPNTLNGKVKRILYLGSVVRYFVEVFPRVTPQEVLVDENRRIKGVYEGDEVALVFKEEDVGLFDPDQKKRL